MKKGKKKIKFCCLERFVYTFTIILALTFPLISVFSKSTLSQANYEVESVKDEISTQEKSNESFSSSRFERVSGT